MFPHSRKPYYWKGSYQDLITTPLPLSLKAQFKMLPPDWGKSRMLKGIFFLNISPHADCFNRCQYIKKGMNFALSDHPSWDSDSDISFMATRKEPGVLNFFYSTHPSRKQTKKAGWLTTFCPNQPMWTLHILHLLWHFFPFFLSSPPPPPPPPPVSSQCTSVSANLMGNSHLKPYLWDLWLRLNAHITNINSDDPCLTKHFKFIKNKCCSCFKELVSPRHL